MPLVGRLRSAAAAVIAAASVLALVAFGSPSVRQTGPTLAPTTISQGASPLPGVSASTPHAGMADAQDPQLHMLAGYESVLNYRFATEMLFTYTPRTSEEAAAQAINLATALGEYSKYGIKPLIIMEPTNPAIPDDGNNLPLNTVGSYAPAVKALFTELRDKYHITAGQMGTMVFFPEPNIPEWGTHNTNPQLFAQNYVAFASVFKEVFPGGNLSMLLNSTTTDADYRHRDQSIRGLMEYTKALQSTPGMPHIDSFGLQGFPESPTDNPQKYLDATVAEALARQLKIGRIWFNTGTAHLYNDVPVSATYRKKQFLGELAQANIAKTAGFAVEVNDFTNSDAHTDWSDPLNLQNNSVVPPLPDGIIYVLAHNIPLSVFAAKN